MKKRERKECRNLDKKHGLPIGASEALKTFIQKYGRKIVEAKTDGRDAT
jgi:hypothetical protein